MSKLEIQITENDIEEFKEMLKYNTTITWQYKTDDDKLIDIEFMSEDECFQRRQ
jgi:hypothetical protein